MKWLAWAVLILSATATYYLINQGPSPSSKEVVSLQEDLPPTDEPSDAPSPPDGVIRPSPRPGEEDVLAPPRPVAANMRGDKVDENASLGEGERPKRPKRIDKDGEDQEGPQNTEQRRPAATGSPPPPSPYPATPTTPASTAREPGPPMGTVTGGGAGNMPFSAFPSGGTSTSGSATPTPQRPSTPVTPPTRSSGTTESKTGIAKSSPLPLAPLPPTPPPSTETSKGPMKPDKTEIPADGSSQRSTEASLSLTPSSVALGGNPGGTPAHPVITAYSFKSAFDPSDKPTVQILRDCQATGTPAMVANCDTTLIPTGGPSVAAYASGTSFLEPKPVPGTKEFEIGPITVGTYLNLETGRENPIVEVSFSIDPGTVPGRYLVRLKSQDRVIEAVFEVTQTS